MAKVKDCVCGMEIDSDTAEFQAKHEGKEYHFCGPACKTMFEMEPEGYISGKETLDMEAELAKRGEDGAPTKGDEPSP